VRSVLPLIAVMLAFSGCGGSSQQAATTAPPPPPSPAATVGPGAKTLYQATNGWAVVQKGPRAVALRLVDGTWRPDRSGAVRVKILGPLHTTTPRTQVAVEISARNNLAETGLWVDGQELLEKGGGTPRKGTIYGTTSKPLEPGAHIAVAYGRTATSATALAWTFRVA